jgi:hypothetical protein
MTATMSMTDYPHLKVGHLAPSPQPAFIEVTAPVQQDDELQVIAICMAAMERTAPAHRTRILKYLLDRYGDPK